MLRILGYIYFIFFLRNDNTDSIMPKVHIAHSAINMEIFDTSPVLKSDLGV